MIGRRPATDGGGRSVAALPPGRRTVVELRDVHGLTSEEICDRLVLCPADQRTRLHREGAHPGARLGNRYRDSRRDGDRRG